MSFFKTNKNNKPWIFFGLCPCRDKQLDCLNESICPDCKTDEFTIINDKGISVLTCDNCSSSFVVAPTEFMRFHK